MNKIIAAIPTMYSGVQFRSRLEAKWAAFFDIAKINWSYEPIDLNGWIPDFVLRGATKVYVEIKPIDKFDVELWNRLGKYRDHVDGDIMVLGNFVAPSSHKAGAATSGWLLDPVSGFGIDSEMSWSLTDGKIDFAHSTMDYTGRVSGVNKSGKNFHLASYEMINDMFKEAQNIVQWKR